MRSTAASVLRLAILFVAAAPLPAAAQFPVLYQWPDTAFPCNGTLQACIDGAGPEDTVEIATNVPIAETIQAFGSVDLLAAPGFTPVFAAGHSVGVSAVGADDTFVRIQGLTLTDGRIIVGNVGTGAQSVQILDNTILAYGVFSAITATTSATGPLVVRIEGNDVRPSVGAGSAIRVFAQQGFASADVLDNEIAMPVDAGTVGILLEVEDGALTVDVIGNRIQGSGFGYGVRHRLFDTTVLDSRVLGNLVVGANLVDCFGIAVEGFTSDGQRDVLIGNNTLLGNRTGVLVEGSDAEIVNNLFHTHAVGVEVASTGTSNRHNMLWSSGTDFVGTTAGPGTTFEGPSFVGPDDYRLAPGSNGIDEGDSSAVPPELATDLAGAPRIQGAAVDIGAYEAPEPSGTLGSLAALLAVALLARRRR